MRVATGPAAACAVLAVFWAFMVGSLRDKSLTYDEVAYAAAGYSQWHYGDYRLQPENGLIPERVAALPMALSLAPFPAPEPAAWGDAEQWRVGHQWLYESGHDADRIGLAGRACCGLFAVALGALVWAWSRRLFGPAGAMVSLILFVFDPTVLANGALMTSDMAAALFLAASAWAIWAALERLSFGRTLLSALLLGALFLTKMSALLILPVALLLMGARLLLGRPMALALPGFRRDLATRAQQAAAMGGAVLAHALVVVVLIWAGYGFRYSAFAEPGAAGRFRLPWNYLLAEPGPVSALRALGLGADQQARAEAVLAADNAGADVWSNRSLDALETIRRDVLTPAQASGLATALGRPSPVPWVRLVEAARREHLLPEAWLYGFTDVYRRSQVRPAFLNGGFRLQGWPSFFPYTFLVKTPLATLGVLALALGAVAWRDWSAGAGRVRGSLPLWALLSVYWAAAIASHLNIGHRHVLPVYAPLFVLCGASARWLGSRAGGRGRAGAGGAALGALLALLALGTVRSFPNYLAYYNALVPRGAAYRHLVDSSLDWGQDLPTVKAWLDAHPQDGPVFISYFGSGDPEFYGIRATRIGDINFDLRRRGVPGILKGGLWIISVTQFQQVYTEARGPWDREKEAHYRGLLAHVLALEETKTKLTYKEGVEFEEYQFARLCRALRGRPPLAELGYTLLVYRLTDAEVLRALYEPLPDP